MPCEQQGADTAGFPQNSEIDRGVAGLYLDNGKNTAFENQL
jgi:hypothetical protein